MDTRNNQFDNSFDRSEIKSLLNADKTEIVNHSIWLPEEKNRGKFTTAERDVILKVSFQEIQSIKKLFQAVQLQLPKFNPIETSASSAKALNDLIEKINNKLDEYSKISASDALYHFANNFIAIFPNTITLIPVPRNSDLAVIVKEIILYIEAIALKISMDARIKFINTEELSQKIFEQIEQFKTVKKDDAETLLKTRKKQIKDEVCKILTRVHQLHPKEISIILMQQISRLQTLLIEEKFEIPVTVTNKLIKHFYLAQLNYYREPKLALQELEKLGKEQILKGLSEFVEDINNLPINPKTYNTIRDLATLLQILYVHPYKNSALTTDLYLTLKIKFNRLELAQCYLDASEILFTKLDNLKKKQNLEKKSDTNDNSIVNVNENITEKQNQTVPTVPKNSEQTTDILQNNKNKGKSVEEKCETKKHHPKKVTIPSENENDQIEILKRQDAEIQVPKLLKTAGDQDDLKLTMLQNVCDKFTFSNQQLVCLNHLKTQVVPYLEEYVNNTYQNSIFSLLGIKSIAEYLKIPELTPRASKDPVLKALEIFYDEKNGPQEHLAATVDLCFNLKFNKSTDLINKIKPITLGCWDLLINLKPEEQNKKRERKHKEHKKESIAGPNFWNNPSTEPQQISPDLENNNNPTNKRVIN